MPKKKTEITIPLTLDNKKWRAIEIFIFGLILYWTFYTYGILRWDIAIMGIGIIMFLKAMYMKSM